MTSTQAVISDASHPTLSGRELEFYDYWSTNVVNPADPHLQRWIDYEEGAVDRAEERTAQLETYEPVAGKRVLEIGCQNGAWLISLARAGADPVGIDTEGNAVRAATVRGRCWDVAIDPRIGDACGLDFESNTFDIVASNDVIEHVPDKVAMVREVMRVLRPGGLAVISAPQRFSLKHLRSDPHYQYAGVSVFPASGIRWYLTRLRGEAVYEVETLPTGHGIRRQFARHGGVVITPDGDPRRRPDGARAKAGSMARDVVDELRQGFVIAVRKPA
ncbi:hypothetical protein BH10ACT3_BH10ACT3_13180 [soil metagenome]